MTSLQDHMGCCMPEPYPVAFPREFLCGLGHKINLFTDYKSYNHLKPFFLTSCIQGCNLYGTVTHSRSSDCPAGAKQGQHLQKVDL